MRFSSSTLEAVHKLSSRHREAMEAAARCGCFYCGAVFPPGEIPEWLDEPGPPGSTALCPRCGIDSVIPEGPGTPLDGGLLAAMHAYWFARGSWLSRSSLVRRVRRWLGRVAWDLFGSWRSPGGFGL